MVSLGTILDPGLLKLVWRQIRYKEREVHLTRAPLARDSTSGLTFELSLGEVISYITTRILDGSYRPHAPLIVEAAKSRLLRRRLSFLAPEDSLILSALVQAARPSLMQKMPNWVAFGRRDRNQNGQTKGQKRKNRHAIALDYEGWWLRWLRYRKLLQVIEDDPNPLLVTSDVVNFFGCVDLAMLRGMVTGATSLDLGANDLLFFIIDRMRPSESYTPRGSLGLPVVFDDTSRTLAHFYLQELDRELEGEGKSGRYTRWVDDMAISVSSEVEGGMVVARIERALGRISLVANSSKTAILSKDKFREYHFEFHNEFLDRVHDDTDRGNQLQQQGRMEFESNLNNFLHEGREGYWGRVLRRYCTESRRIRSKTLLRLWKECVKDHPVDAAHVFDYIAFFQGSLDLVIDLFDFLGSHGPLFEDLQIFTYETLLLTPFLDDPILRSYIVNRTYDHYLGRGKFDRPTWYVRGLQALVVFKFGATKALGRLATDFPKRALESPEFAAYAFPVIAASDQYMSVALEGIKHIEDSRLLRLSELLKRLVDGDDRATGMLLGLLEPKLTRLPERAVINSRALPLVKIALKNAAGNNFKRLTKSIARIKKKVVTTGDPDLVDWVALSHLV